MNPITHLLAGWNVANLGQFNKREMTAITVAGVIPDIDGFGLVAERMTLNSAQPLTWWSDYHHVLAHNLPFGILISIAAFSVSTKRIKVAALSFLSFHLHLLGDVVGAGGPDGEHWPIPYLYPFSPSPLLEWQGQWAINAWPNVLITALLLLSTFYLAWKRGYSLISLVSQSADKVFIETLRRRFSGRECG